MELHKLFLSKVVLNNSSIAMNVSVGKISKSISLKQMVSGNQNCCCLC